MPKQEQVTKYNIAITDANGNTEVKQYLSEAQVNEAKAEATKTVGTTVTETKAQTFAITLAESVDDILQCVPNAEVALDYFNYGYKLNQQNVMRDLMKSDWEPIEGVYDLNQDVQQPKERRVADPLSASRRSIKALFAKLNPGEAEPTDEEINAVLQQFARARQAA